MHHQKTEYPVAYGILAALVYSLIFTTICSINTWIPSFIFPVVWIIGSVVGACFFVYIVVQTGKPASVLPSFAVGIGSAVALSQTDAEPNLIAASQFLLLFLMAVATQCTHELIKMLRNKDTKPRPLSPIVTITLLVALLFAGYGSGTFFAARNGYGPFELLSQDELHQQLSSNNMQRRWEAFSYTATHKPELLTELCFSEDHHLREQAIRTVKTRQVEFVIQQLQSIIQHDPDPLRVDAATEALSEIQTHDSTTNSKNP